ncbi:MAG TPA: T9SS type A sorting domain-containing protein [candidate division WOR-3 bacterium]|uniref:T9SS type A sorting domain-containing protein n=1 Tax=candidate division WOR-3 bacterium TaxID=2052148 RepID=A0A9C9K170_UNCW3|nr:T9SS type A sorting domain-containing protein [candidate division WOR-3 bacterium]
MKRGLMCLVCLLIMVVAAEMKPVSIPASAVNRITMQAEKFPVQVEVIYTGTTNYPPWLEGRDAPWEADVHVDDVYNNDDQLLSMAQDALGRIYVCYETMTSSGTYGWGLATSIDNGQTWDNRVYYASIDVRYPEIAISDDGKIWVWGSLVSPPTYNDEVIWMRSYDDAFNDPDSLDGFYWFGAGNVNNRTYPEAVTWGNNDQLVLSTWTFDNGTETVTSWIYATDGGIGGSWSIYSLNSDGSPDGMTSIGVNYDGSNYIAVHGWEQDEGGGDWNVMCMFDTLGGSGGLSGWGTSNTNPDRNPSVFCSNGKAYIAYQGYVGAFDADIMFNYSTDYGISWASIVDLTNDTQNEAYPRLYGNDATIGVCYLYSANRIRFNYSLDNGVNWLSPPETVDENSTVNSNYHSVALLYTSSYWYAAWEDTRNSGTDGLEIYTSRRIMGQGDITHHPAIITINYNYSFGDYLYAEKYLIHHSSKPIDPLLDDIITNSSTEDFIPVFVMLAKQLNPDYLIPRAEQMPKPDRRRFVIDECQRLANEDQRSLLLYLKGKEKEGKVRDIVSQWTTNTICFKAKPEVIREVAYREDVWEIGYSEPLQIIGVQEVEEPTYEHIDFTAEDGREICWGVAKINADDVWNTLGYTGSGVIVGHMDSGVNYNHTDLNDHMWDGSGAGYPNHGYDFSNNDNDPMDDDGHGTQTAGIVAGDGTSGSNTGVAPDAQIMALKIYPGTNNEMGQAIQFALNHNADLLSCSIGWEDPSSSIKDWCRGQSNTVYAAGIVWCNAAGNGRSVPPYGHYTVPQDINSPADCPGPWYAPNGGNSASIAVGATDQTDNIASWSSYGPTQWNTTGYNDYPYPPGLIKPDLAAPGVGVKSLDHATNNGYDSGINGTSFAQPHVAGTVALMLERNPALTPRQIDSLLQTTALDIETSGRDTLSGNGRIDALQAVNAISEGAKWAQLWVINQASATGILQVTNITKAQNRPWIISVSPTQFTVPINDSQAVWVTTDTTGQGLTWGQTYYDTLLIWSNSIFDDNPDSVPVVLIMATVGVKENETITPAEIIPVLSAFPNPFNKSVKIDYAVPYPQNINLIVYDVCGKKVRTLVNERQKPGNFAVVWDGKDDEGKEVAAGIYFGRIKTEKGVVTNKLIFIK